MDSATFFRNTNKKQKIRRGLMKSSKESNINSSNNVRKNLTIVGFKRKEIHEALPFMTNVVTSKYFPLSMLAHSEHNGTGVLRLSGEEKIFEGVEALFNSLTFLQSHKVRVNTAEVKVKDARRFLIEIAKYFTRQTDPLSFCICTEEDIIQIECTPELWYMLIRFIYGTTFEEIETIETKKITQSTDIEIPMEA
jgi:hypothetical protein